ncbi:autotransporter outer membrane beta-barrel domain-containing protein [Sphingomonas koreensis]|nr:autotransporter outer membrane beta-barrel domain-containing protein [Sphingomonas koreensis]
MQASGERQRRSRRLHRPFEHHVVITATIKGGISMRISTKTQLALGVASAAFVAGFSTPAAAQCTTDTTTATCSGTNTTDAANTAMATIGGDDVTLAVTSDAQLARGASGDVAPLQTGAVAIDNAGTIGTTAAPAGIFYIGDLGNAANSFSLTNSGTITGNVYAANVGGDIDLASAGSIGGSVYLAGNGDVSADIDGDVGTPGTDTTPSALGDVSVSSGGTTVTSTATGPTTTGGVTTTTSSYREDNLTGTGSVSIGADAHVGNVRIAGTEGAEATIAGAVGAADQVADLIVGSGGYHYAVDSTSTSSGTVSTNDGTTHYEDILGDTAVTIAEGGSVSGAVNGYGAGTSAVTIDGTVGSESAPSGVLSNAYGETSDDTSSSTYDSATGDRSSASSSTTRYTGGDASVAVGETGVVNGYVSAAGDGDATVTNAGAITGDASAQSGGVSTDYASTSSDTYATDADGNATYTHDDSSNSDSMATGAIGAIANADTGVIGGSASAQGVGGATVNNAGEIDGDAFAGSDYVVGANRDYVNHSVSVNNGDGSGSNSADGSYHQDYIDVGGDAAVTNAAGATIGGTATASGVGDASVANAGEIDGNVTANARGYDDVYNSGYANDSTYNTGGVVTASSFDNTSSETVTQLGGAASVSNAAGGLIGDDPYAPVSVQIAGTTGASLDNAGRINGNVSLDTTVSNTSSSHEDAGTNSYDDMGNPLAQTYDTSDASTETAVGGDLVFDNAAGGLITGSVTVSGDGDATLSNAGSVIGTTTAISSHTIEDYANATHSATTYADDGSVTSGYADETDVTDSVVGGDVTGTYAGTNGALQFAPPFGGASDGSVTQIAAGDSMATVTGSIFGDFTGNASSNVRTSVTKDGSEINYGTTGLVTDFTSTHSQVANTTYGDSASALAVDGGEIAGNVSLYADKAVTASLDNGAAIDGSINAVLNAYDAIDTDTEYATTTSYDDSGALISSTDTDSYDETDTLGTGTINVAIGEATVGGSVFQQGAGGANSVSLADTGEVGGSVSLINYGDTVTIGQQSTVTATPGGSVEDDIDKRTYTPGGGDVSATVDGVIGNALGGAYAIGDGPANASGLGGLDLETGAGDATATLTGQVGGTINVLAGNGDSNITTQTDRHYENGALLSEDYSESYTAVGGTASLTVDSSADNIANLIPAGLGDVYVIGRAGSTLDIAAGSILAAATGGSFVQVGGNFADGNYSATTDYVAATRHSESSSTVVGGDATLTNAGTIGYDGGDYSGSAALVLVDSITNATLTNSGKIFGSVGVFSLGEDQTATTDAVNVGDVTEVDTVNRTYVPVGGNAVLDNDGLISGGVAMAAADGTLTNNGVIRGGIALGASVDNYATEATDTATQLGEETVTEAYDPFAQTYTLEQNGLLGTGIAVTGAMSTLDDTVQTSDITATIDLNDGSVTAGGVYAEVDADTGARLTNTRVNLDGSGYLGLSGQDVLDLADIFGDVDPQVANNDGLSAYAGGVRVVGVDTMSKTGGGTFAIFGQTYAPASNTNATPDFTLDLGAFDIVDGEVQLGVTDESNGDRGTFGIKGDLVNDGTLVLGRRVMLEQPLFASNLTSQGTEAIDGVNVYQLGNFTQGTDGTLVVGMAPALVRYYASTVGDGSTSNDLLGVGQGGVSQGYFTSYANLPGAADLGASFVTLDGDLELAGTVNVVAPKGGIYTDGQSLDLFSVSGTVSDTATVNTGWQSAFVSFGLDQRADGDRTVVSLTAQRQGYDTVATNSNAAAAGAALTAAIPGVVAALNADAAGTGTFGSVGDFDLTQDLATIIAGFDSQLDASSAAEALNELASADFYGSLSAIDTTAPFINTLSNRLLPDGARGFNLWLQPSGTFGRFDGSTKTGAQPLRADTYGGSGGFAVASGNGGEFGLGFGYGRTDATSRTMPVKGNADTYMIGAYARQNIGAFTVAADGVFGWSNWDTTRIMPLFSRTATADFDSKQVRFDLRGEYRFDLGSAYLAPFGELSLRHYRFDGFDEDGAGAVGLSVEGHSKTVFTPTIGAKLGTSFTTGLATLRPEASISYSFQGDINGDRDVAYLGAPDQTFRLQGVDPSGYASFGLGLFADIGQNSGAFIRGSYATGGGNDVASLSVGVKIGF